ncbi:DUF6779 domain-containing protein [Nocardia paucivorans]|uniref:DUF6779 domain-containing protein n=1 Tax=Nocardia paucivorans TaxID=114259 RepID=UPI0012FA7974|nr:DUF6779 domain-containing protein [Nocardia paucivorans]
MVSPSRSSVPPTQRGDTGKLFVGVLVVLGLIAGVFLALSESVQFIRVGVVVALWAAVLSAIVATKYRKEAELGKARADDLKTVYRLQLEREINARREYELGIEARVRAEVGAEAAEMAALRAELSVLRQQLERLFDGGLPIDRPALHADSFRVPQLVGVASGESEKVSARPDGESGAPAVRSTVTPVYESENPARPQFASPDDDPVTAEFGILFLDQDQDQDEPDREKTEQEKPNRDANPIGVGSGEAVGADTDRTEKTRAGLAPSRWAKVFTRFHDEPEPTDPVSPPAEESEPGPVDTTSESKVPAAESAPGANRRVEDLPSSKQGAEWPRARKATVDGGAASRRHRHGRADTGGSRRLSVAEIMANLQEEDHHD